MSTFNDLNYSDLLSFKKKRREKLHYLKRDVNFCYMKNFYLTYYYTLKLLLRYTDLQEKVFISRFQHVSGVDSQRFKQKVERLV